MKSAVQGCLATIILASASSMAMAQSTDDIIVTAQKRAQSVNSVGMSITAVSAEALKDLGVRDVADLTRVVPSLTVQQSQFNAPVYTIRGIGFYETSLQATPAVSVYVDEVALPYPAMTKLVGVDLERVEVLKGPQGTLYGQNSTGGAINYIAAKPTASPAAGFDVGFGRFATFEGEAFVSGPLSEALRVRVAGRATIGGDWQKSYTRDDSLGQRNQIQGRFTADWTPTENLSFLATVTGWRDRSDTVAPQLIRMDVQNLVDYPAELLNYPLPPRSNRAADWTPGVKFQRNDRFHQLSLRTQLELSDDVGITSITAYQQFKTNSTQDGDGLNVPSDDLTLIGGIKSFSQELRIGGTTGPLTWVLGANYMKDKVHDRWINHVRTTSVAQAFGIRFDYTDQRSATDAKSIGLFGNAEYALTDRLTLQGGLRYTDDRRDFRGCSADIDGNVATVFEILSGALSGGTPPDIAQGSCVTLSSTTFQPGEARLELKRKNWSWRAGLNYEFHDRSLVYANVSRGNKAGSFPTLAGSLDYQFTPVEPETVVAYEAGIKARMLDGLLQANGAVFYYDYKNKQLRSKVADPIFGTLERLVNIPKSRAYGVEAELVAMPATGLTLRVSGTYVNSKIKQFTGINSFGATQDFAGTRFPATPEWSLVSDIQYDFPVSGSINMFVGGGATGQTRTNGALGELAPLDIAGYVLLDARIGIHADDDAWKITLWGKNITNRFYAVNSLHFDDTTYRFTGQPVTYGIRGSFRF